MVTFPLACLLHPELRALDPGQRSRALREARRRPFDVLELLGMAAGLVAASLFIRHGLGSLFPAQGTAARLAIAAIVLACAIGPFLVRHTRRGLQASLGPQGSRAPQ